MPLQADSLDDRLDRFVAGDGNPAHAVAGLQYALIRNGELLRSGAAGCRRFDDAGTDCERRMRSYHVVRIASVSKMVVAITALRLVEQGLLDLDHDVSDYLGFRLRNPQHPQTPITLRQLMSHQSSLSDAAGYAIPIGHRLEDYVTPNGAHWNPARFAGHKPGARFVYTNLNAPVIAQIIEAVSDLRFDQVTGRLFAHLGVRAGFNFAGMSGELVAPLYRKRPADGDEWDPQGRWYPQVDAIIRAPERPYVYDGEGFDLLSTTAEAGTNGGLFAPQGGLRISADELAELALHILNPRKDYISADVVDMLFSPQWRAKNDKGAGEAGTEFIFSYGLGAQIGTGRSADSPAPGVRWAGHMGEAYGLLSGVMLNRDKRWGIIYAMTGTASPLAAWPGRSSNFSGWEETLQSTLYEHLNTATE